MKGSYRALLKRIYKSNSVHARDAIARVERTHGDHRDFYPLVSLINSGHIGYTGATPSPDSQFPDTDLAYVFQCYSQGPGKQTYKTVKIMRGIESEDVYFYVGAKSIEYFETRKSDNRKIIISAFFSLLAGLTVALASYYLKS